jgi:hypothetical protein
MIIKALNAFLIMSVLVAASLLYSLEQNKRSIARAIARTDAAIAEEKENIKLLTAEWSNLTRPDRIRTLAALHTQLQPVEPSQLVHINELSRLVPADPFIHLEPEGSDEIGQALQDMGQ